MLGNQEFRGGGGLEGMWVGGWIVNLRENDLNICDR
jgi:hypothetical protein